MPQVQPTPEIFYRIQNVDYGYYLELPSTENGETVEGRILKDSLKQHWKFVAGATKNTYKIINAASSEDSADTHYALGVEASDSTTAAEDEDDGKTVWTMLIPSGGAYCTITTPKPGQPKTKVLLQMEKDGKTSVIEDKRRDFQRWKLVEVLPFVESRPPLTRGTYRIRNIDGTSVLTVHSDALTLDVQEGGKHQAWEIIPKGNGNYEIKKVDKTEYLSWQVNDKGVYKVTIGPTAATWVIRNFGGFVYSISPKLPNKVDLGLTAVNPDTNEILLTTRETVRNQVWFIEPSKFTGEEDHHDEAKRLTEVPEGKYVVRNYSNNAYAYVAPNSSFLYPYPANSNPTYPLIFHYESATSPYFSLQDQGSTIYIQPAGDMILTGGSPAMWYLVKDASNKGYFICSKGSGKRLAWSGTQRSNTYTLVAWQENDPLQLWTLTPRA